MAQQPNGQQNGKHPWSEHIQMLRDKILENRKKIFGAAAEGVDPERYAELLFQAIGRKPDLGQCTLSSLVMALTDSATLGLPINGLEAEGYVVPRKRRWKDREGWHEVSEAQFQTGYLGRLRLAYDSPLVAGVTVENVFDGDQFAVELGSEQKVTHIPKFKSSIITHTYGVLWLTSGCRRIAVMSDEQISDHRNKFAQGFENDKSAWQTNRQTMNLKTVLLRLLKFAPLSSRARRVLQAEEYLEAGLDVPTGLRSGDTQPSGDLDALAADDPLQGDDGRQEQDYGDPDVFTGEPTEEEQRAAGLIQ